MSKLRYYISFLMNFGIGHFARFTLHKLNKTVTQALEVYVKELRGKTGLEIGGPSHMFTESGYLPIYPVVRNIDGINFSSDTLWEGNIITDKFASEGKILGKQIIGNGVEAQDLVSKKYDFVLSSHNLEHIANPLRAIKNWKSVLNQNGSLLLILPNKSFNFDHNRHVTTFEHLVTDYDKNTSEDSLEHVAEVTELHDLSLDPGLSNKNDFKSRLANNSKFRTLHHHVYSLELLAQMVEYFGFKVLAKEETYSGLILFAKLPN